MTWSFQCLVEYFDFLKLEFLLYSNEPLLSLKYVLVFFCLLFSLLKSETRIESADDE